MPCNLRFQKNRKNNRLVTTTWKKLVSQGFFDKLLYYKKTKQNVIKI